MATDLDPLFVKALKLLHSKSKDSTDQLREMLNDVLSKKKSRFDIKDEDDKRRVSRSPSMGLSKSSSGQKDSLQHGVVKKEAEKRQLDKIKQEPDLFCPDPKKIKIESSRSRSNTPEPSSGRSGEKESKDREKDREREKTKEKIKKEKERHKERDRQKELEKEREREKEKERERLEGMRKKEKAKESSSSESDNSEGSDDESAFALSTGISCNLCKNSDVSPQNQLVECQECHNLYHQDCHRPAVSERDLNDPRFVWYCSKCTKNMKKFATKSAKARPNSTPPQRDSFTSKASKPEPVSLQPFRRMEPLKASAMSKESGSSSSKPLSGLAGLAANLSGKSLQEAAAKYSTAPKFDMPKPPSSSSSSKGRSTSSSSGGSSSNASSADKRLQMMKKKAAAKAQDKKSAFYK